LNTFLTILSDESADWAVLCVAWQRADCAIGEFICLNGQKRIQNTRIAAEVSNNGVENKLRNVTSVGKFAINFRSAEATFKTFD
jgi:hypothetical protein